MREKLNCPLCGYKSNYIFESKLKKNIFKCSYKNCSHLFTPYYEFNQGVCQRIEDLEKESEEFLIKFKNRNKRLANFLFRNILFSKKNISILDYGSGNAHLTRVFRKMISKESLLFALDAKEEYNIFYKKFGLIPINDINEIKPNSLDLIIMIEVIEHIEYPKQTLKSLKSKLKSNGKIFITTPAASEKESETSAFDVISHIHFFTEKSFGNLIRNCGFRNFVYVNQNIMQPKFFENQFHKNKIFGIYRIIKAALKIIAYYSLKKILKIAKTKKNKNIIKHIVGYAQ